MIISYIRLGKQRRQLVLRQIKANIKDIELRFNSKQIKYWWKFNSLSNYMDRVGQLSHAKWDEFDLVYVACQIIEFKNHIFNDHDSNKLEVYRIMQDLNIPVDKAMLRDYNRAFKRKQKYGSNNLNKVNRNIESRVYKSCRLFLINNKKKVLFSCDVFALVYIVLSAMLNHNED